MRYGSVSSRNVVNMVLYNFSIHQHKKILQARAREDRGFLLIFHSGVISNLFRSSHYWFLSQDETNKICCFTGKSSEKYGSVGQYDK